MSNTVHSPVRISLIDFEIVNQLGPDVSQVAEIRSEKKMNVPATPLPPQAQAPKLEPQPVKPKHREPPPQIVPETLKKAVVPVPDAAPEPLKAAQAERAVRPEPDSSPVASRRTETTSTEAVIQPTPEPSHNGHQAMARPAAGDSSATGNREQYLARHFAYIRDRIMQNLSYPPLARKKGWSGQVKIAFRICMNGDVEQVTVVTSSGYGLLDRHAVDTVKKVSPFPRPPVTADITMPITYHLR